jgi:acetyltransferase-like isoleucine patch superfamily enzyme
MILMKKRYYQIRKTINQLFITIYTAINRFQFASWGAKSRIEFSAKLSAPYLISVGSKVRICEHAWLNAKDDRGDSKPTLIIGDGTYIGRFVHINAWQQVVIEINVLIADRVYISDADHHFENPGSPISVQDDYFKGTVRLKEGCWLGIGVVVFPGITIGKNSIVGANSVVTQDVPDYTIVAGIPAKIIKKLATN